MHYKQIQTHDLFSFAQELQKATLEGFVVLEDTQYYPQIIGNILVATLGKAEPLQTEDSILAESKPVRKKKEVKDE